MSWCDLTFTTYKEEYIQQYLNFKSVFFFFSSHPLSRKVWRIFTFHAGSKIRQSETATLRRSDSSLQLLSSVLLHPPFHSVHPAQHFSVASHRDFGHLKSRLESRFNAE